MLPVRELVEAAIAAREKAYAPYSQFYVGAALLGRDGTIYQGCNIENAAYGPSNCAERTAFFKAVSEGVTDFEAICIVGGKKGKAIAFTAPCGVCRQVMMEFCNPKEFQIIVAEDVQHYQIFSLEEILPLGFGPNNLAPEVE